MPRILTKVRVFNPGVRKVSKPKRRLSLAQKLHFGTKRQRAAAKLSLSTGHKKRRVRAVRTGNPRFRGVGIKQPKAGASGTTNRKMRKARKAGDTNKSIYYRTRQAARVGNPGEIITLAGLAGNPGKLKKRKVGSSMKRRRTANSRKRTRRVRRANPKVVVRYASRRRRRNLGHPRVRAVRRRVRRRNPGAMSGGVGMLVGIFGGAALTGAIASRIPGQLSSGIAGYLTTGVIAYAQGMIAGKVMKNPALGKNMVTGGLIYLGLKVASDLIPGLALPFGLSGLGAIAQSSFAYPQIPANNSMVYPSQTPVMPAKGMGRVVRMGRMS